MPATVKIVLQSARQALAQQLGLPADEARIEAQLLLRRALGDVPRVWLMTHENDDLPTEQADIFAALLQRRLKGEPVAYILGQREFYGLSFNVNPHVLIPRPDTETLVEAALAKIPQNRSCRVLDMGTGSGIIAIAIAKHRPWAQVVGIDRSPEAVQTARENAAQLHVDNVEFNVSDWFSALQGKQFDLIASNPPYIAAYDPHLSQGDLRFEPLTALASGDNGLADIRQLVAHAPQHLTPGGWLLLEHGYDQASVVAGLLGENGFADIASVADLAGVMRVTMGRK